MGNDCVLMNDTTNWSTVSGVISGPAVCIATVQTEIGRINTTLLMDFQRENLSKTLVLDFADATGLRPNLVKDRSGDEANMNITAGNLIEVNNSLVAIVDIELPS